MVFEWESLLDPMSPSTPPSCSDLYLVNQDHVVIYIALNTSLLQVAYEQKTNTYFVTVYYNMKLYPVIEYCACVYKNAH